MIQALNRHGVLRLAIDLAACAPHCALRCRMFDIIAEHAEMFAMLDARQGRRPPWCASSARARKRPSAPAGALLARYWRGVDSVGSAGDHSRAFTHRARGDQGRVFERQVVDRDRSSPLDIPGSLVDRPQRDVKPVSRVAGDLDEMADNEAGRRGGGSIASSRSTAVADLIGNEALALSFVVKVRRGAAGAIRSSASSFASPG